MPFSETVVILAAGRGTRMQCNIPKVLMRVHDEPVLGYVLDFWLKQGAKKFIFVLGYGCKEVLEFIRETHVDYKVTYQANQEGIANAILQVEGMVADKFIVQLGDCLNVGSFEYPDNLELGYGIWANERQRYTNIGCQTMVSHKGIITSVMEKPDTAYPGIGTYFFDRSVFPLIKKAKPSVLRNEIEITDILNEFPAGTLKAVPFYGEFVNCTTRRDIEYAEKLLSGGR